MGDFHGPDWVHNDNGEWVDRWDGTPKPPDPKPFKLRKLSEQEQITYLQVKMALLDQRVDDLETVVRALCNALPLNGSHPADRVARAYLGPPT